MSLTSRLNQLFSPKVPDGIVGLSVQHNSVSLCAIAEDYSIHCQHFPAENGIDEKSLESVSHNKHLQGVGHIVLSGKDCQLVQVEKPSVPPEEINGALKWQVKDLVTIAPDNMVVDYFDGAALSGGIEKINVVCAEKDKLTAWLSILSNGKCQVESITIEELAFASLLPHQDDAKLLVCQQPNEDMLLLIVKQGRLYFQRRLRGLAQIASKTEQELDMTVVDNLSLEIQRSTDYFERQLKQAPIKGIEVLVPMENESYLARRLAENSNTEVTLFTMPQGFEQQRAFAAAIGATRAQHIAGKV